MTSTEIPVNSTRNSRLRLLSWTNNYNEDEPVARGVQVLASLTNLRVLVVKCGINAEMSYAAHLYLALPSLQKLEYLHMVNWRFGNGKAFERMKSTLDHSSPPVSLKFVVFEQRTLHSQMTADHIT